MGGNLLANLLGNKIKGLQQLAPLTQLLASLDQAFGQSPGQLSGDFNISNGVLTTENLALSAPGSLAKTRATVDFPNWRLLSETSLFDNPNKAALITFVANGPIDAPTKTKISGRILRQGLPAVKNIETHPLQKVLPNLLDSQKPSSHSQDKRIINPEKLLEGIFKNLRR